jgi:hypothetical protein
VSAAKAAMIPRKDATVPTITSRTFNAFNILYCLLAGLYIVYSLGMETGLPGYVSALQIEVFGSFSEFVTMLITMVLFGILWLVVWIIAKWLAPSLLVREVADTEVPKPFDPGSTKGILWMSLTPLILSLLVAAVLYVTAMQEKNEKVYDINAGLSMPPAHAKFIQLTGVPGVYSGYTEDSTTSSMTYLYFPLTSPGWKSGAPVQFFVLYQPFNYNPDHPSLPSEFFSKTPKQFAGKLGGSLPVLVKRDLEKSGLKIGQPYYVVDYKNLPNDDPIAHYVALAIGVCLSFSLLLGGLLRRRMARRNRGDQVVRK